MDNAPWETTINQRENPKLDIQNNDYDSDGSSSAHFEDSEEVGLTNLMANPEPIEPVPDAQANKLLGEIIKEDIQNT